MKRQKQDNSRLYFSIFLIIVLLSVYLRFTNLSWETFGYSEVETWQAADEYLKGNFVHNIYTFDTPPLRRYLVFLTMKYLGASEFYFRIISATTGVLLVIATFFIARKFYDIKTATFASAITAFSIIHLQFSRYLTDDLFLSLFYIPALYFFWLYVQTKSRRHYILLGIFVGLALASRFMTIYLIATLAIYAALKKLILVKRRPQFSISIDNNLIKSFAIAIAVFFIAWPFSLVSLQTNITIDVPSLNTKENTFSKDIPIFLLSFGKRLSNTDVIPSGGVFEAPLISYFLSFMSKENLLIIILFFAGLYYMFRNTRPVDKFVLFSIAAFFFFLWIQKWGFSYRYVSIIIPFIAIIAAQSINLIKKDAYKFLVICLAIAVMLSYAVLSGPAYALSYNPLNRFFYNPENEGRFSEGMKESLDFLFKNCDDALTDAISAFNTLPYRENFATTNVSKITLPTCVVRNTIKEQNHTAIDDFINNHNCTLAHRTEKSGVHLNDIFVCR